jgi:hypothetical protein
MENYVADLGQGPYCLIINYRSRNPYIYLINPSGKT